MEPNIRAYLWIGIDFDTHWLMVWSTREGLTLQRSIFQGSMWERGGSSDVLLHRELWWTLHWSVSVRRRQRSLDSICPLHRFCSKGLTTPCSEYWSHHKHENCLSDCLQDIINRLRLLFYALCVFMTWMMNVLDNFRTYAPLIKNPITRNVCRGRNDPSYYFKNK